MRAFIITTLFSIIFAQTADAGSDELANRFVEYWNMGPSRSAQTEAVFNREFIARRGPEGLARILGFVYADNGEIAIDSITSSSDEEISFVAAAQKGNWMQITLGISADLKIAGMAIQIIPKPAASEDKGLNEAQIIVKLEETMAARAKTGAFSGSVLLARRGEVLFAHAYGMANRDKDVENTLDTAINLGSMNKMFTSLAIAQLVAEDKLSYSDTVGQYLPDYPNQQVRDEVTLHQLLTHTSGLGSYWNDAYQENKENLRTVGDFADLFAEEALSFEPGSEYQYSNCGPVVLGLIIEAVSGQDYYDYIRTHIYTRAGMVNSDHYNKVETASGKATGYFVPRQEGATALISNQESLGNIGSPAGGGYASAKDLFAFAVALYDGRLIDAEHREYMTTFKVKQGRDEGYAYLYSDKRINGERYIGHNGGAPGINAEFSVFPDSGYIVVVLSNTNANASPVADQLRRWIGFRE